MVELKDFTDEQLFNILKEDNESAFDEIYNRYWSKLFNQGFKRSGNREVTEELLQDLFTSLWVNRHKVILRSSLSIYLSQAIKYLVLNQKVKEANHAKFVNNTLRVTKSFSNAVEESIALQEMENLVAREVNRLPDKCKSVFELSRFEHYSNKDIALKLDITEKTVENHIAKAIKHLRSTLKNATITVLILSTFFS